MSSKAPLAHPAVWRAGQLGHGAVRALGSQHPGLDAELPGHGWPLGMLTELICREAGIGELRLLMPVLRQLTRERRIVVLLGPPLMPYAPALADFGIDLDYLVVVDALRPADRLWAIEDVAMFLGFSVRLTEEIVRDPRFPQPRLVTKGGVRRWSPARWHAWVDAADATWLGEVIDGAPAGSDDTEMAVI